MYKVDCPRCMNTSGHIRAFSHVQGGVCFKCGGKGFVLRKTKPQKKSWFKCFAVLNGEFAHWYNLTAPSEVQALTKWQKEVERRIQRGAKYALEGLAVEVDQARAI